MPLVSRGCVPRKLRTVLLAFFVFFLFAAIKWGAKTSWQDSMKDIVTLRKTAEEYGFYTHPKAKSRKDPKLVERKDEKPLKMGFKDIVPFGANVTKQQGKAGMPMVQTGGTVSSKQKSFSDIIQEFSISLHKDVEFSRFRINVSKTHATSVTRDIPDTRHPKCDSVKYDITSLPSASIIIPLHNEPWSTFERLINSILSRSPRKLLKEIIIIDDLSDLDYLGAPLDKYVQQFGFMKIYRAQQRLGTMKSRVIGANLAKGDVLVFLDSHSEVNVGWLEPLLYVIGKDSSSIVQPSIDVVDPNTFIYRSYFQNNIRGHFKWSMAFEFVPLSPKQKSEVDSSPTESFNTPAIVGCAFAVNRIYFTDIGGLDTGMRTWGGEDVELSLRVWLCGGRMKISPCSHVAHIFKRGHPFKMAYSDLVYNNKRTAETWLGDYRKYFYYFNEGNAKLPSPEEKFKTMDTIKEKYKCKDFGWLLKNVFPELEVPSEDAVYFGQLRNLGSGYCFGPSGVKTHKSHHMLVLRDCFLYYEAKNFELLSNGPLKVDGSCVGVLDNYVILEQCDASSKNATWTLKNKQLVYSEGLGSKCAMHVTQKVDSETLQTVMALPCDHKEHKFTEWNLGTKLYKSNLK